LYTYGAKDLAAIFFYGLISIVVHAIVQEYGLDKINKKLHLSKTKHSKFNESGQLLVFLAASAAWGIHILIQENIISDISSLWAGYPDGHAQMSFMFKFFFLIQMSYWLHCYPELYFQKTKREDMQAKIQYASLYLAFVALAYFLNFTRIGMVLLILKYLEESLHHACKLLHFAEKTTLSSTGFKVWNVVFVGARLVSIILALLTLNYGMSTNADQAFNFITGNFNTPLIRLNVLVAVCLVQAWLLWNFIHFQLRRKREAEREAAEAAIAARKKAKLVAAKKKAESQKAPEEDELPEADQQTRRQQVTTRKRK